MPAKKNDYATLIETTDRLLRQTRLASVQLRRKPEIHGVFLQEMTKFENILDVLKKHIRDAQYQKDK
jgi:hypothetical protein